MINKRNVWTAILIAATTASILAAIHCVSAGAAAKKEKPKWVYARLEVDGDKIVFIESNRVSTIQLPMSALSGNVSKASRASNAYTTITKEVRDHPAGALNMFGARGWEAVSVMPREKGYVVLLKQAY